MSAVVETIDGGSATLPELRRVGIDALLKSSGRSAWCGFFGNSTLDTVTIPLTGT